jgi:hypothetical protein
LHVEICSSAGNQQCEDGESPHCGNK